jgi:hypothetical protein
MPTFRRPPRTLISGFGVAGSVLAAVVVAFAVASSIVAYSITSVDQLPRSSGALVLDPLRTADVAAKPLVLRPARPTAHRRASAAAGAGRGAVATVPVQDTVAGELSLHPGRRPVAAEDPQGGGHANRPSPSAQPAPDRLLEPVGDVVGATGDVVGATTDALVKVTAAVGARTEPVASTVKAVVDATAEALRTAADRSGKVVGRLLGDQPPR